MYDKANDLIREYSQVPKIYFHCALSQVRGKNMCIYTHNTHYWHEATGPKSARIYAETLNNLGTETEQKVKILRFGFEGWHDKYSKEKDLIEDYDEVIWSSEYRSWIIINGCSFSSQIV